MLDPYDSKNTALLRKLAHKRWLAALALLAERLTFHLWRLFIWVLFFFAIWLFQLPLIFGEAGSVTTALVFLCGLLYLSYTDLKGFRLPTRPEINRRIDKDSNIKHRPVASFEDKPANTDKNETLSLWIRSRKQLLDILPKLKNSGPKAFMARNDPYALRLGVMVFFIAGLMVAGPTWKVRVWNGLTPVSFNSDGKKISGVSLWVTPPEYTGMAQMILEGSGREDKPLKIPQGSTMKIRVHGGITQPVLRIDEQSWPLEDSGNGSYMLEMPVPEGTSFKIRQAFLTRGSWNFTIIPDNAPKITLSKAPEVLSNSTISFPFKLFDDYSVKTLTMRMALDDVVGEAPIGNEAEETRSVMSPANTEFNIQPIYDLSSHPWAGLPVVFYFTVEDDIAQTSSLPPTTMTLPERAFTHPVAKKLIAYRKKLIWDPYGDYEAMAFELEDMLSIPQDFQDDFVVFLSLRTAASRLYYNKDEPTQETAEAIIALLWDTALRVEDGNISLAIRNLRDAQMALENALQNPDTTEQETAELMHALREAMAEYLLELQKELQKSMAEGQHVPMIPPEMLARTINPDALANFLDQMESEMMAGNKDNAQKMLSQLQRMMDLLGQPMTQNLPMDMQMMADGINELQELIERQEDLLAQTRKQAGLYDTFQGLKRDYGNSLPSNELILREWGLENIPPAPSQDDMERAKLPIVNTQVNMVEQEALRYILGQLMIDASEALDKIPEEMGLAEMEMRGSADRLSENSPNLSVPHQEKAIEYLKKSQEQLTRQLMARAQQMTGLSLSGGGMRYDPLGRPYGGHGDQDGRFPGSPVKIPDEQERKRAQEILREIRRRSGELDRPDVELEYYHRLLRQF